MAEELRRLLPSLRLIRSAIDAEPLQALISVDTYRASVAEAALEAGADWINDISGGSRDPEILKVVAQAGCPYVLMHSRGDSQTMDGLLTTAQPGSLRGCCGSCARPRTPPWQQASAGPVDLGSGAGLCKTTEQNLSPAGIEQLRWMASRCWWGRPGNDSLVLFSMSPGPRQGCGEPRRWWRAASRRGSTWCGCMTGRPSPRSHAWQTCSGVRPIKKAPEGARLKGWCEPQPSLTPSIRSSISW